jgi:hypothetical protein
MHRQGEDWEHLFIVKFWGNLHGSWDYCAPGTADNEERSVLENRG